MSKGRIVKKFTIVTKIYNLLKDLQVGDEIDKVELIDKIYGRHDYFTSRTFDVNYSKAKKLLVEEFPDRQFRCVCKQIVRQS